MVKWILNNIHTILLVIGLFLSGYAAFRWDVTFGYAVAGFECIVLAIIIDKA